MKIAYFTDTYLPQVNGVTNTLSKLGEYLNSKSIHHMFFSPEYPDNNNQNNAHVSSYVKRFKSVSLPMYPECRISIPYYNNICKAADDFKPDIIHLITSSGIGLRGLKYARDKNIPIVSSFHTYFDAYLKYYKVDFLENALWKFFSWFHSYSSINFCPSQHTMSTLKSKGIDNLKIWSRGINSDLFSPNYRNENLRKSINPDGKMVFLYVGRLALEKDLDILMESIKKVNDIYPEKAQFILTGDGPYTSVLKENAPRNVLFTGYLKGLKLSEMYATCDVFLFPSSTETFGNVVIEAMASGLPVVAVNSGGVTDNVIHNYNGLLSEPRNVNSFTNSICKILNSSNISSLSINARRHAENLSWNSVFDTLISDYESVIHSNKIYIKAS